MTRASLAATLCLATTSPHDCKAADEQEALRVAARALFTKKTILQTLGEKESAKVIKAYEKIPKEFLILAVCAEAAATKRISFSWRF